MTNLSTPIPLDREMAEWLTERYQQIGTTALTLADHLYDFEYGTDPAGHRSENRELRKLFNRLNDLHEQLELADYHGRSFVNLLRITDGYVTLFGDFESAFGVMGLTDDLPGTKMALETINIVLRGQVDYLRELLNS